MKPRITITLDEQQYVSIYFNEEGRDLLVRCLQQLDRHDDHAHLDPACYEWAEIPMSERAYRPNEKVLSSGKLLFRPDDWDRAHFPHVMPAEDDPEEPVCSNN